MKTFDPLRLYSLTFDKVVEAHPDLDPMSEEFIGIQVGHLLDLNCNVNDLKYAFNERNGDPDVTDNIIEDAIAQRGPINSGSHPIHPKSALASTPMFGQAVYDNLPPLLKECIKAFPDQRQKDLFILSALAAIGTTVAKCHGYHTEEIHPTLYTFIVAPPASGKSAMNYVERIVKKVHQYKKQESESAIIQFKQKEKEDLLTVEELSAQPKSHYHLIPGNSSGAKIIQHLHDNGGYGLIIETEADTLSKSMGNGDWGNFSDVLRDGYHHESVRMSRRNENEYIEVESPAFSVCLSGTPNQVKSLIGSTENGLFSRFQFYGFESAPVWQDKSPGANPVNIKPHFEKISERVLDLHLTWNHEDVCVSWTKEQWKLYNTTFKAMYHEVIETHGLEAHDLICRLGNACLRMSMTLTIIKAFDEGEKRRSLVCDQSQLELAIRICKVQKEHTLLMFSNMPKRQSMNVTAKNRFEEALETLPIEFKRSEAIKAAKSVGIKIRTMGNYLKRELGTSLTQPMTGYYRKVE